MAGDTDLQRLSDHELVEEVLRRDLEDKVLGRVDDEDLLSEIYERDLEDRFGTGDGVEIDDVALEDAKFRLSLGDLGEAAIQIARVHPDLARLPDLITRTINGEA